LIPEAQPVGDPVTRFPDDMALADPGRWPALAGPLAAAEALGDRYRAADQAALRHQRQHRALTMTAAVCGAAAVLFAVVRLGFGYLASFPWLTEAEVAAALAALAAVVLGLVAARRTRWLVHRHRAERLRLLHYHFLTDPTLWTAPDAWRARFAALDAEAARIAGASAADLHAWLEADAIPDPPPSEECLRVPAATVGALVDHYRTVRLSAQIGYFRRQAARNARLDRPVRYIPVAAFFVSVVAAFGHFAVELAGGTGSQASVLLIVLAAGAPVVGAAVRTVRLANEFSRNTVRFRAKQVVLDRLAEALRAGPEPVTAFRELWCAEQVLESEHREWLRLMADAEWFG
jgi:hypothetical protein